VLRQQMHTIKPNCKLELETPGASLLHSRLARTLSCRTPTGNTYKQVKICLQHKSNWFESNHPRYLGMKIQYSQLVRLAPL
jgi:hypothetical protein